MAKINKNAIKKSVDTVADKKENISAGNNLKTIGINEIIDNPKNTLFRELTAEEMDELKASILEVGLLEPLVVVKATDDKYRLVSGHQRKKALQELGMDKVAVNVVTLEDEDEELALIHANIKQRKLTDMELARVIKAEKEIIQQKIKKGTLKGQGRAIEQVAQNLEISSDKAKRLDRLNKLIPEFQKLVETEKITTGKAEEIGLIDIETQTLLFNIMKDDIESFSLEEIKQIKKQSQEEKDKLKKNLITLQKEKENAVNENVSLKHTINTLESLLEDNKKNGNSEEVQKLQKTIEEMKASGKKQYEAFKKKESELMSKISSLSQEHNSRIFEKFIKDSKIKTTANDNSIIDFICGLSIDKQNSLISLISHFKK